MSDLTAFLCELPIENRTKQVVISNRFKDAEGNPLPWTIRGISFEEACEIEKQCVVRDAKTGVQYVENTAQAIKQIAACVVDPNLNNARLQDHFKVKTPEALIGKLLTPAEGRKLLAEIRSLNDESMVEDALEPAKN